MTTRRRRSALKASLTTVLVLILAAGGYAAAVALTPISGLKVTVTAPETATITASDEAAQATVNAQTLPTAIGWLDAEEVWSNDETVYSLASVSKLVSMMVTLEAAGLSEDRSTWPELVWSEANKQLQDEYIADDGIAFPTEVGTVIALEDVFNLIFLPSANDFTSAYVYSVFGDNVTFLEAVDRWSEQNNLDSLELVEPTGIDEGNKSTVADMIRIGRLALANPIISEFVKKPNAVVPGIAEVENTNLLLNEDPRVLGLKTGSTMVAGYNFVVAASQDIEDREVVRIAATMGRDSIESRAESGREMLQNMVDLPSSVTIVEAGEPVATVEDWQGSTAQILISETLNLELLPAETAVIDIEIWPIDDEVTGAGAGEMSEGVEVAGSDKAAGQVSEGDQVGTLTVTSPLGVTSIPLVINQSFEQPSFVWKLRHPAEIWFN